MLRGFPNSGCQIFLDDPDFDGKAAKQLVDYLADLILDNSGRRLRHGHQGRWR